MKVRVTKNEFFYALRAIHPNVITQIAENMPEEIELEATPLEEIKELGTPYCKECKGKNGHFPDCFSKQEEKHFCEGFGWPKIDCPYCMNPKQKQEKVELPEEIFEYSQDGMSPETIRAFGTLAYRQVKIIRYLKQ